MRFHRRRATLLGLTLVVLFVAASVAAVVLLRTGLGHWATGLGPVSFLLYWIGRNFFVHRHNAILNERLPANLEAAQRILDESDDDETRNAIRRRMVDGIFANESTGCLGSTGPPVDVRKLGG